MVLKVNLQCRKCHEKVEKILSKFRQESPNKLKIRNTLYDEEQNTVTIKVVCSSPERIRDKLRIEGGKSISSIEIIRDNDDPQKQKRRRSRSRPPPSAPLLPPSPPSPPPQQQPTWQQGCPWLISRDDPYSYYYGVRGQVGLGSDSQPCYCCGLCPCHYYGGFK